VKRPEEAPRSRFLRLAGHKFAPLRTFQTVSKMCSRKPIFTDLDTRAFTNPSRRREHAITTKGHPNI
jgi:hypothetical protein